MYEALLQIGTLTDVRPVSNLIGNGGFRGLKNSAWELFQVNSFRQSGCRVNPSHFLKFFIC